MGLLDSTQESTDKALQVMASRPLEPERPEPKHSAWTAPFRAVAAASAEVVGNAIDVAGAYGQVAASAGGLTPGFNPEPKREDIQEIDWRTQESKPLYDFSESMRPDPFTAGAAENIVFGLSKGLTKAIGSGALLGPAGGAMTFGVSEGMTEAEILAREGVDLETRTKVGITNAAINTAAMALPVAGQTIKQTVGLALAGGPAAFVAQQQITRGILERADYGEIAQRYDPLDPVGLTLATLLPLGFGAAAMRGAARGRVFPESVASQESIDAAMVHNLTALRDKESDFAITELADAEKTVRPITEETPAQQPVTDVNLSKTEPDPSMNQIGDQVSGVEKQADIAKEFPDIPVAMREDGTVIRAADQIEEVRKLAREGTDTELGANDAPLLKVAAECLLSRGA